VETVLAGLVVAALGVALWRFRHDGYLPQPFHYGPAASLMDLYDSAYWANRTGAYEIWRAIYPPLSFVLMRLVSLHTCYGADRFIGRHCDWLAMWALLVSFVATIPVVYLAFRKRHRPTAIPRTVALCLGLPMLYGLERGNLLIPCFVFFVLAQGGLLRSRIARWLAMAISLNLKPYLLIVIFPYLAQRRWRWLAGCGAAGLAVYLVSFLLQGSGTPLQLLGDVALYARNRAAGEWGGFYYATSYWPLVHMMSAGRLFTGQLSVSGMAAVQTAVTLLIRGAQLGAAACFVAALTRPAGVNVNRFTAMATALVLTTITTGSSGYVQIFLFFLVFLEPWSGWTRIVILVATYLLCIPADYTLWPAHWSPVHSYLGNREVLPSFGISVGHLLRPGVLLIVQYSLIVLNFQDLLRAPAPERPRRALDDRPRALIPLVPETVVAAPAERR
jgi:hypothetical protein